MTDNYTGEQSTYNEGAGQMERINRLQQEINRCWVAPLNKDIGEKGSGRYGYQIIFCNNNSLFGEVSSKLTIEEFKEGNDERLKLIELFEEKPIWIKRWRDSLAHSRESYWDIISSNWKIIEEALFQYGLKIRKLLEAHNMTAPKQKDPTKAIYGN